MTVPSQRSGGMRDGGRSVSMGATPGDGLAFRSRILVVDDSTEMSRLLSRLLTLLGHDVRTAHDGVEGVESASEFRPDVVLMDIGLPGLDGYDGARRIRGQAWSEGITLV